VSTCNQADFDTMIFLYSGACGSLVCKAWDDATDGCGGGTTHLVYGVMPSTIYILVNGFQEQRGHFDLTVSVTYLPPPTQRPTRAPSRCPSETLEGDVFGSIVYFNGGKTLPPGSYTISYIGGCSGYWIWEDTWDVNFFSGWPSWYLVGKTTTERIDKLPPTEPSYPYNSFDECVDGNLDSTSDVVFSLKQASVVGIWFGDDVYGDNTAGHPSPTWILQYNECSGPSMTPSPTPYREISLQPSMRQITEPSTEASMRPSVRPSLKQPLPPSTKAPMLPSSVPSWMPPWTHQPTLLPLVLPELPPNVAAAVPSGSMMPVILPREDRVPSVTPTSAKQILVPTTNSPSTEVDIDETSLMESIHPSLPSSRMLPSAEPSTISPPTVTPLVPTTPWKEDHTDAVVPNDSRNRPPSFAPASIPLLNHDDKFVDEVMVRSVELKLFLVSRLARCFNHVDILGFERIVADICTECYGSEDCHRHGSGGGGGNRNEVKEGGDGNSNEVKEDQNRRQLQDQQSRRRDARDIIQTNVVFIRQQIVYDDNDMPVSIIEYDQHFLFNTKPEAGKQNDDNSNNNDNTSTTNNNGSVELYTPPELAKLPFNETAWNMRLGNELRSKVQALQDVKLPLEVPDVPDQAQFLLKSGDNDPKKKESLSEAAASGIFAVAAFVFTVIAIYGLRQLDVPAPAAAGQKKRPGQ